jgi:hypothetical protein
MSKKGHLGIIVCLCALLLGATVGCGSSEGVAPVDGEFSAAEAAGMLPRTVAGFSSFDVRQLRDDEDLAYFYNQWLKARWQVSYVGEETGLHASDIWWWVEAYEPVKWLDLGASVTICEGEFDMGALRDRLSGDYHQDEHDGIEVWRDSHASVAIAESLVILGDADSVDQCIDTIGGNGSLRDDADVALLLGQLPPGFLVFVDNAALSPGMEGMEVMAFSVSKEGPRSVEYRWIAAFVDYEHAESAVDEFQYSLGQGWGGLTLIEYEVHRRGRLVEVRQELDIGAVGA